MVNKRNHWSVVADILTMVVSLLWVAPLFFAILISVRPTSDPLTVGNIFFGRSITLENYQQALELAPWEWHYLTSILVVIGVLGVQLVTITMAGYAFGRMKFFGRNILLFVLLVQLMIPSGVLVVQNLT
ncbi:MAG TPA: hypothetical protein PLZ51_27285, partial [Aggregatilineales bacterium]|nr:hypothetical protein [Aggregatilineales bacterium]